MSELRKVAVFVTRGHGARRELLVFDHHHSGTQTPAGTVEPGEAFETAALRETEEETGLTGPFTIRSLGERIETCGPGTAVLTEPVKLRHAPQSTAYFIPFQLGRALRVSAHEQVDGFTHVVYEERDVDATPNPMLYLHVEGWLETRYLAEQQRRAFYHFHLDGPAPARWQLVTEGGNHRFDLYWVSLTPRPSLFRNQDQWLVEFHATLR